MSYTPKQFRLSGLKGLSDKTLEMHFKLYEGYVKETNRLSARIAEFLRAARPRARTGARRSRELEIRE